VHRPFEQLLRALCGRVPHPPRLDDAHFDEQAELDALTREGSRSGVFILRLAMGLARYHLGDRREACEHLEAARRHLDAAPSTWHIPVLHQFAALAGSGAAREESIAALRTLADCSPVNFAHKLALVEGRHPDALALARAGGWTGDLALAHELAGDLEAARAAYAAWGAAGVVSRLAPASSG
jgi:hypothetical protein